MALGVLQSSCTIQNNSEFFFLNVHICIPIWYTCNLFSGYWEYTNTARASVTASPGRGVHIMQCTKFTNSLWKNDKCTEWEGWALTLSQSDHPKFTLPRELHLNTVWYIFPWHESLKCSQNGADFTMKKKKKKKKKKIKNTNCPLNVADFLKGKKF